MEGFSFLFALYEGGSGNPATEADAQAYATQLNITQFPVMADGSFLLPNATPMQANVHPQTCILGPDMTILHCVKGHNAVPGLLDTIKTHAGL